MIAKELRIGNIVQTHTGRYADVDLRILSFIEESGYLSAGYYPIVLTEEILLNCGFEKFRESFNWSDWKLGDYRFHFRPKKDCSNCFGIQLAGSSGHNIVYFNWNLQYLHQLQNLYFALTGEELEVNL